ncbi:MAG: acyl-CoA thioesterase [Flavobacteriales bacterium]
METQFEKTPSSKKVIQFQDCDPYGHLNNGRYFDYFLNAREDHLANFYDLDIFHIARKKGVAWFVGKHEIVYRKPAGLREEIIISSEVINVSDKSLIVEFIMYDKDKTHIKAVLRSTFVHLDLQTMKAKAHDEELSQLLSNVLVPRPLNDIFQRALELEAALKGA